MQTLPEALIKISKKFLFHKETKQKNKDFGLPSYEMLVFLNERAIEMFPDKKSDKHEVKEPLKLRKIVQEVQNLQGDLYDCMVLLLRRLTVDHVFMSGNRRTALTAAMFILRMNNIDVFIKDSPLNSDTLLGLRNNPEYYGDEELKNWFKTGEIRKYVRPYPKPKKKK